MPEYLAPGVYVEETSFRSKSIEGVSTSTTAFVGLARKGPVTGTPAADSDPEKADTPEILTSYVDFERVFGGFEDIELASGPVRNYLAHAVNAFFANGGSRLYVARVAGMGTAPAASATFAGGASFAARTPGRAGNGRIVLSLGFSPITENTWKNLPAGTVVRVGEGVVPTPASLSGGARKRFSVEDGQTLELSVNGSPVSITIRGLKAQVSSTGAAADPVAVGVGEVMEIAVDGETQRITLADGARDLKELVGEINRALRGVSVSLDEATSIVTIATDSAGTSASLEVKAAPAGLLLPAGEVKNPAGANNNVKDLSDVGLADLQALLAPTPPNPATLVLSEEAAPGGKRLVFTTVRTGTNPPTSVAVTGGSARGALGLLDPAEIKVSAATDGSVPAFWVKVKSAPGANETIDLPGGAVSLVSLAITAFDADGRARLYDDLGLDHRHPRFVGNVLPAKPARKSEDLENLFFLANGAGVQGATWAGELANLAAPFAKVAGSPDGADRFERQIRLEGGDDGDAATQVAFAKAFTVLERLDDISIVAAPGYSAFKDLADAIEAQLLIHVEKRRSYRIGVLDSRAGQSIGEVRNAKARVDSKYAALYYPWVVVANPLWRPGDASVAREIAVPPSGFVCGIYARNDVERGVFKAPANEVVRGALRFESDVNFAQQEVLNPLGVNCLRFFPGRGYRVWGGRTTSSDPEWKYVNVRRYFNYLERSIDVGTQWAVFEPNGERLWANVKETISSFLYSEWRSGALLGTDPKEAFFVRCDRSTMDQNDLDNGRLVCLIGVAVVKPAEFVIFRIGQKTADART